MYIICIFFVIISAGKIVHFSMTNLFYQLMQRGGDTTILLISVTVSVVAALIIGKSHIY